jgi:N-acetylglucosamine-6-sulfatase
MRKQKICEAILPGLLAMMTGCVGQAGEPSDESALARAATDPEDVYDRAAGETPGDAEQAAMLEEDALDEPHGESAAAAPADAIQLATGDGANVVLILADDLSMNLVHAMPEVQRMMEEGLSFSNYFVSNSLCCPSRASLFTGKFPHNTGVLANVGPSGGLHSFDENENPQHTFATALSSHGYMTAMLGKYMNGYHPGEHGPARGWTHWAVAGNGYGEYDYWLNHDGQMVRHEHDDEDYLTDVLSRMGDDLIRSNANRPFLIELATFAPHAPYTPARRDLGKFLDARLPRTPAFGARPGPDAPAWLRDVPPLGAADIRKLERTYRRRLQAVQAIDRLIKRVRESLASQRIGDKTYVIFTSDNGYHLGEHSLRSGKKTAFDHDIHVPLVVVGPGVPRGRAVDAIVQNIDLCPTFRDLGGLDNGEPLNGKSLVPFLRGREPQGWRDAAFIEHLRESGPGDPDAQSPFNADPPSYHALRRAHDLYVEYEGGAREYHDLGRDPYELDNTARALAEPKRQHLHQALEAMRTCKTATECWASQHVN